jgi:hypothetical protein
MLNRARARTKPKKPKKKHKRHKRPVPNKLIRKKEKQETPRASHAEGTFSSIDFGLLLYSI